MFLFEDFFHPEEQKNVALENVDCKNQMWMKSLKGRTIFGQKLQKTGRCIVMDEDDLKDLPQLGHFFSKHWSNLLKCFNQIH